ncbi:toll-like receptor 4 [Mizuhopecten yessoensis]|uniref:toll-like receptor 4 n=1 Tax=Mizuhopecten yessoensis TaxID=6573 RepID=UPI000B4575F8|nr:toll-like receptor 4 [Mizuhopecten yessoensis]
MAGKGTWTALFIVLMTHVTYGYTCHSGCVCANNFTVVTCTKLQMLKVNNLPPHTKDLSITKSNVGPVFNYSLSPLVELELIDLSQNSLTEIAGEVLRHLGRVKRLSFRGNRLHRLFDDVFMHTTNLQFLDLSHNSFSVIPDVPFRFLHNLKVLNLSFNHLTTPVLGLRFQVMINMELLDFTGNNFHTIPAKTFEMTQNWNDAIQITLNFSFCGIHSIEEGAFDDLRKLRTLLLTGNSHLTSENLTSTFNSSDFSSLVSLNLSKMNLTDIGNILAALQMAPLAELFLSHNKLTNIPHTLSDYHANLKVLKAHHNKITEIGTSLTQILTLTHLDLSYNKIASVDSTFGGNLVNLHTLILSNNTIGDDMIVVTSMASLEHLDLSNNQISVFGIPDSLTNLQILFLAGNSISELNQLMGLNSLLEFDISRNQLSELKAFLFPDSSNIQRANFSGNVISEANHQSFRRNTPIIIDISFNKLQQISNLGWEEAEEVHLQANLISEMDRNTFYGLYGVKYLDLSHNMLTGFDADGFVYLRNITELIMNNNDLMDSKSLRTALSALSKLEKLDISHNNYTMFPSNMLKKNKLLRSLKVNDNKVLTFQPDLFNRLAHLVEIDLSNNIFRCDCALLDFRDWLRKTKVLVIHRLNTSYMCEGPSDRKGMWVVNYSVGKFECQQTLLYIIIFSSVGAVLMLVIVIGILVFKGYYQWRKKLRNSQRDYTIEYESVSSRPPVLEGKRPIIRNKPNVYMNGGHLSKQISRDSLDFEVENLMRKRQKKDRMFNGYVGIPLVGLAKEKDETKTKKKKKSKQKEKPKQKTSEKSKLTKGKKRQLEKIRGQSQRDFLKEIMLKNMKRDAAQRYAQKMNRYHEGRNDLMVSSMVPYFYDRHGVRHSTANMLSRSRHQDIQGHGDVIRVPRPIPRPRPRHSHSVPDMYGYVNSIRRGKYPLNPQVQVVNHHGNRHLNPSSQDLASSRRRYRSLGNLRPMAESYGHGQGRSHHQSETDLYRNRDNIFLPARYDDVKYHTISARSSRGQFGSRSEWI